MTEAKSESCRVDGANADFRIEDFCVACVAADIAGETAKEVLETAPREDFLALIFFVFGVGNCLRPL